MPPLSFMIAGVAFIVTIAMTLLTIYAYSMSDAPSQSSMDMRPLSIQIFVIGTAISILIAASHYIHFRW